MANLLTGNIAVATHMYQALYGQAASNAVYNQNLDAITSTSQTAFAAALTNNFASLTDAELTLKVLTNLGITAATVTAPGEYDTLVAAGEQAFAAYPTMRGQIVFNLVGLFGGLEADATYGAAATTFNNQAQADYLYSSDPANISAGTPAPIDPTLGESFTLTTGTDLLIGTALNDTFIGTAATWIAGDHIIDTSSTDNDTYNLANTASITSTHAVDGVENINITLSAVGALSVAADLFTGVNNLTVTRTDLIVGGSTIVGDKSVTVTGVDATEVVAITTGAGTKAVSVTQTAAGVTLNADTATGTIAVTGAGTINAANAATTVAITAIGDTTEDAVALTINAAKAATSVTTDALFTGAIAINAAAAATVTVNGATGGATVNAAKATTITVNNIDASGATITAGTLKSSNTGIVLDGTSGLTDAATVTAAGTINLNVSSTDTVDLLTLGGNGAAATFVVTSSADVPALKYTLTGAQNVTLSMAADEITGATVTDSTTAGTTIVKLTAAGSGAISLTKVSADQLQLAADINQTVTVATGANLVVAADQNTTGGLTIAGSASKAVVYLATGDDTAGSGATILIETGDLDASSNISTLHLTAEVGALNIGALKGAGTTAITIDGSQDVTVTGTVTAASVNSSASTGALTATFATTKSVTAGVGDDDLTFTGGAVVYTVDAGDGINTITVTDAADTSLFASGAGDDVVAVNTASKIVVATGAGSDTVTVGNYDTDAVYSGGDGTSDILKLNITGGADLSDNANFAFAGFETVDLTGAGATITISAAQFGGQSFKLVGDGAADALTIVGTSSADTISASTITRSGTTTLTLNGGAGDDVITGSAGADVILAGVGSDTISGGSSTDTYSAAGAADNADTGTQTGYVINLSSAAVTSLNVFGSINQYTADSITSVAAGTSVYLYNASGATNSAAVDTLSSIENVIGSDGADYIVSGNGANTLTGGSGNDIFAYTSLTQYGDTITTGDFVSTADKIRVASSLVSNGTSSATAATINGTGTVGANDVFLIESVATASGAADTAAEIATALSAIISTNVAAGEKVMFAVNDTVSTFIWSYTAGANAVIDASELSLVVALIGTTVVATGDFIIGG